MAYSDFTSSSVTQAFPLTVNDETALFTGIAELTPSARLQMCWQEYAPIGASFIIQLTIRFRNRHQKGKWGKGK